MIFGIHAQLIRAPESYLYVSATKLAAEKIADKKLSQASMLCLDSICTVKDPQRVIAVVTKTIGDVKSPLVHEALLNWFKKFCILFGVASLSSQGIQDSLSWVLKECEFNNVKVRNSAVDVVGEIHSQLGPVLQAFIKSRDVQSSTMSLLEKAMASHPHNESNAIDRELKCITLSVSNNSSSSSSNTNNASSLLSIPTTDIMASLKSDCVGRINETEGKAAWKIRRDAMEEVRMSVDKCGGLISTEGKAMSSLKQLFLALRNRLSDSQSNLKPTAAMLLGSLLNHLDDGDSQAKLGKVVFPHLANAAMNDMKKTMRDAALSALLMGTEQPKQNGGGANLAATESFIVCLESQLTDAALKSTGLPEVLTFLTTRLESCFPVDTDSAQQAISAKRQLSKVIVQSLLSSKAGTRSSAEKLLSVCTKNGIAQSAELDNEIGKLLPAQQRTVRSFIPKNSIQDQALVDTFKRPSSARQQSVPPPSIASSRQGQQAAQRAPSKSSTQATVVQPPSLENHANGDSYNEANPNPLHPFNTFKSTKQKRLSVLGRSDNWPEYPEDPSGDPATLQSLQKTWSHLISPTSIQLLFPKGGFRSHEDAVRGCELLDQSIEYSRSSNDGSFLEQLDLIFKWLSCALSSRDHTTGLRSLLSTLQGLFDRLHELSYVMNDLEATILLPHVIEKAAVAKLQFKSQFMDILSLIRTNKLYPTELYGSYICIMKVVEKSKSNSARALAAAECSWCVEQIGPTAIGSKGVATLAKALSVEKLTDIRKSYLELFDTVVQKSSLDRVLKRCVGSTVTDKTRDSISDWCTSKKRPSTAPLPAASKSSSLGTIPASDPKQSRLRTPSRQSAIPTSNISSPRSIKDATGQQFSSSSVATGALRSRLARSNNDTSTITADVYTNAMDDIIAMINDQGTLEKGQHAIHMLGLVVRKDASDGFLNASQIESASKSIASDLDRFVSTLASALKFCFAGQGGNNAKLLPSQLIQETVNALSSIFRDPSYHSSIAQEPLEVCLREVVDALLDDKLDATNKANTGNGSIVRSINKVSHTIQFNNSDRVTFAYQQLMDILSSCT